MSWLQPFGYADPERSLFHDTAKVLREVAASFDMILPVEGGNQNEQHIVDDLRAVFSKAYGEKYRSHSDAALQRIRSDVDEYRKTGALPYYIMRAWCGRIHGEAFVSMQMKLGQQEI